MGRIPNFCPEYMRTPELWSLGIGLYWLKYDVKCLRMNIAKETVVLRDGCSTKWIDDWQDSYTKRLSLPKLCERESKKIFEGESLRDVFLDAQNSEESRSARDSEKINGTHDNDHADNHLGDTPTDPNRDSPQWMYQVLKHMIEDYDLISEDRDLLRDIETFEIRLEGGAVCTWDPDALLAPQPGDSEYKLQCKNSTKRDREERFGKMGHKR